MITKVTRDVLDVSVRPIVDGINIDGNDTTDFTIDGTIIGGSLPSPGIFTTLLATTFNTDTIGVNTSISVSGTGSNFVSLTGNGISVVNNNIDFSNSSIGNNPLQLQNSSGVDTLLSFVRGLNVSHFGIDATDSQLKYGGGNIGGPFVIWHAGNDGPGSGLNADSLQGARPGTNVGNIPVIGGPTSATTTRAGTIRIANSFDVDSIFINDEAITPEALNQHLNNFSLKGANSTNRTISTAGYQRFPNGFLIQWGMAWPANTTITLPVAYISANHYEVIIGTEFRGSDGGMQAIKLSGAAFATSGDTDARGGPWITVGHT